MNNIVISNFFDFVKNNLNNLLNQIKTTRVLKKNNQTLIDPS